MMNSCQICGRMLRSPVAKFCKEPCSGEFTCMCCGELKESSQFPDYREEGGAFKSTCRKCFGKKVLARYEPRKGGIKACVVCGEMFEYRTNKQVLCGKKKCKAINMAENGDRYSRKQK